MILRHALAQVRAAEQIKATEAQRDATRAARIARAEARGEHDVAQALRPMPWCAHPEAFVDPVSYNPYKAGYFVKKGTFFAVKGAGTVWARGRDVWALGAHD